jgi:flagellar motility protein MotE (MotC chaperone)
MAKELTPEEAESAAEKKRLQDEKKQLKKEQKQQKKEAKKRAKEIAKQQDALDDDGESNGFVTFIATVFIVLLWIVVICAVIKLDIGGFGSSVMTPILKNVPVVNKILPGTSVTITSDPDSYGGYSSLQEAVDQIKSLELQIEQLQNSNSAKDEQITSLNAEVSRLQEFEKKQVEFQRIRTEFYEEVVYSENGPGAEEYKKYYEEMDSATAEYLYKQVVTQLQESEEIQDYAETYSEMKPKQAAAAFEKMTDNLTLVAKILNAMNAQDRAKILDAMDSDVVAKLTKIMDPES